jgi:hypothetical protein
MVNGEVYRCIAVQCNAGTTSKLNFANGITLIRYSEESPTCEFSNIVRDGEEHPEEKH